MRLVLETLRYLQIIMRYKPVANVRCAKSTWCCYISKLHSRVDCNLLRGGCLIFVSLLWPYTLQFKQLSQITERSIKSPKLRKTWFHFFKAQSGIEIGKVARDSFVYIGQIPRDIQCIIVMISELNIIMWKWRGKMCPPPPPPQIYEHS